MRAGNSFAVMYVIRGVARPSILPMLVEIDLFQVGGAVVFFLDGQPLARRWVAAEDSSWAGSRRWVGGSREVCAKALVARGISQREELDSP